MISDEKKILRYMDWGIYLIFVPIILLLIPTNRIIEKDPYFSMLMLVYMVVIHTINRRFNFVGFIFKREYQKAALSVGVVLAITYFATYIRVDDIRDANEVMPVENVANIRNRVLSTLCFLDICFTVMLGLVLEIFRQKIERQNIEAQKGKAELAVYKSQINPHFMFNTLNTIYALNLTGSKRANEVIIKFSNIVKYMYQNSDKEKIMISEEVKYLQEFIDLHSLRLSEETKVTFTHEVDDTSEYIPSMILITFVENVFKYGVSSTVESEININLQLKDRVLTFTSSNTIFSRGEESSGIGIENCRKRLSLLYPNRYTLERGETEDNIYKTTLRVEL
ncbi:MAG: sensor histidine kinase [Rikenellaceae bacterium]